MQPIRVKITRAGNGFLAEDLASGVFAGGASAEEAAELARTIILRALAGAQSITRTFFVRLPVGEADAFIMQPLDRPFQLSTLTADPSSFYFDSSGNASPVLVQRD